MNLVDEIKRESNPTVNKFLRTKKELVQDKKELRKDVVEYNKAAKEPRKLN